jgi:hypothetical protein
MRRKRTTTTIRPRMAFFLVARESDCRHPNLSSEAYAVFLEAKCVPLASGAAYLFTTALSVQDLAVR